MFAIQKFSLFMLPCVLLTASGMEVLIKIAFSNDFMFYISVCYPTFALTFNTILLTSLHPL